MDGGEAAGTYEAATAQEVEAWLLGHGQHPVVIRIDAKHLAEMQHMRQPPRVCGKN